MAMKILKRKSEAMTDTRLREYLEENFSRLNINFDTVDSIEIDVSRQLMGNLGLEMMERLINQPDQFIYNAECILNEQKPPDINQVFKFRPIKINNRKKLRELGASDIGKLVAIECMVRKVKQVHQKLKVGWFQCAKCEHEFTVAQELTDIQTPFVCPSCQHSAEENAFFLNIEKSTWLSAEDIYLEENKDNITGMDAYRMYALATDDICQRVKPGMRCIVNGIIRPIRKTDSKTDKNKFDIYLEIISIESLNDQITRPKFTQDDLDSIQELSHKRDILKILIGNIAPDIFGLTEVKTGLLLAMFGGVDKKVGTQVKRGRCHVLMIGDPSSGKSRLLRSIATVAPRSVFASGKMTSTAGMVACCIRDEADGQWDVEGGAMVKADGGVACLDEIQRMSKEDKESIHEPLEEGTVSFNKAGMSLTLNARCTVIAAANPKKDRFDPNVIISEQIELDPALLARFDLIFPILDEVNKERDKILSGFILKNSQLLTKGQFGDPEALTELNVNIDIDLFRKYILYARNNINPILSDGAMDRIQQTYVSARMEQKDDEAQDIKRRVAITPRQLEALIRLTEASARVRLSKEADETDADLAIKIFSYSMDKVCRDKDGKWDIDKTVCGRDRHKEGKIDAVIHSMHELIAQDLKYKVGIPFAVLRDYTNNKYPNMFSIDEDLEKVINILQDKSIIFAPKGRVYTFVG